MGQSAIVIQGAREHNLRDVNLSIPRGTLTTITGISGSGKSSLAFDTIFKEGQRRFVESLSAYARQFLGRMEKPKVDHIEGLSPTVSIDQKSVNRNPRSTVGTITEIHDHLRLLFARLGEPHCPKCGVGIVSRTVDGIVDAILTGHSGSDVILLAPVVRGRKGEYRKDLAEYRLKGFARARVDGRIVRLDEEIEIARHARHDIEIVLDRMRIEASRRSRLAEAVERGLAMAAGLVGVLAGAEPIFYSSVAACPTCGVSAPELEPRLFSFNTVHGACPRCGGLGRATEPDPALIVPDPGMTVTAILRPFRRLRKHFPNSLLPDSEFDTRARELAIGGATPWNRLTEAQREHILRGTGEGGLFGAIREAAASESAHVVTPWLAERECSACLGTRLRAESRAVFVRGQSLPDISALTVEAARAFLDGLDFTPREERIAREILKELRSRLGFLADVGLGYMTLERSAATLSGGESQRIRLATQVGSGLKGVLYVLDEPSIGLHQRDNRRLIATLARLRDAGNTVFVVEHDRETMEASDFLVDVGPGAGRDGGEIVAAGTLGDLIAEPRSVTGRYLSGRAEIPIPAVRRTPAGPAITVRNARAHNLKGIDVSVPLGVFTVVTGVSGSGKSTLVNEILRKALAARFHGALDTPGAHDAIEGLDALDKVVIIDQSPIGRTPRSNPATYSDVWGLIRDLFADLPESRIRGYPKGRFSFNVRGGRCEACGGAGVRVIEMQFLADVEVDCESCRGQRFNPETLEIRWRDRTIRDILEMTVSEAVEFFAHQPKIARILGTLRDTGLGYVRLGQTSTTLSGGEAQRLKLASELRRPATGRTLYLLDEPTTGLHFQDIETLLLALQRLVDAGNTVLVIEHNLDVIKVADWIIDLGPEGGGGGGRVVWAGPLPGIVEVEASHTGRMLAACFAPSPAPREPEVRREPPRDLAVEGAIRITGASLHNLKNVDVTLPTGRLSVITGVSGSGKTSLAFDTIFAEGQRRFVESLSTYARQFLGRLSRAPVERIEGLSPSIAIDQKASSRNPRSTVATVTEIHDYFRLLYARVGTPHCPSCRTVLAGSPPDRVFEAILEAHDGGKGRILAPLHLAGTKRSLPLRRPADLPALLPELEREGFVRLSIDGVERPIAGMRKPGARCRSISVVVDRVSVSEASRVRILDAVEQAYARGWGLAGFEPVDGTVRWFSRDAACATCGFRLEELTPRLFSWNSHEGACPECTGLGVRLACDPERLIAEPERPLFQGALISRPGDMFTRSGGWFVPTVEVLGEALDFDPGRPWNRLPERARAAILDGLPPEVLRALGGDERLPRRVRERLPSRWPGFRFYVEDWYRRSTSPWWTGILEHVMREDRCAVCEGRRLRPEVLAVTVDGRNIAEVSDLTVDEAIEVFRAPALAPQAAVIAEQPLREIRNRLRFLADVGLSYLTLSRNAATLSGGESQRIRLATQLGNRLTGVTYVLDEPTIGLHPRDTERLLGTLRGLRDLGNSVVVVEHDADVIRSADWVVDLGPGAGHRGGTVTYQGELAPMLARGEGLTAGYLTGALAVPLPARRRKSEACIRLHGASANNLRDIDVRFPLGCLTAVTGVSGSGKSSLVMDCLVPAVREALTGRRAASRTWKRATVEGDLAEVVVVDQSPPGRSGRSNPATCTGAWDEIRTLFAALPLARMKGFDASRFSFNTGDGRCRACDGRGVIRIEMLFLSDVFETCEACRGRRFDGETLTVEYRGRTIADVLDMEIGDARTFFEAHPRLVEILDRLVDVGLGYMRLGQSVDTLSGGEAQRLRLASELTRRTTRALYVFDEPTTGLHFEDTRRLVAVFQKLVDLGHTVVVIEHNLDVIKAADRVIDLGPGGGADGGGILVEGTPEIVAAASGSETGRWLAPLLAAARRRRVAEAGT